MPTTCPSPDFYGGERPGANHYANSLVALHLASGKATPMTYMAGDRQFVVIAAGGHGKMGTKLGDYLLAYALPKQT